MLKIVLLFQFLKRFQKKQIFQISSVALHKSSHHTGQTAKRIVIFRSIEFSVRLYFGHGQTHKKKQGFECGLRTVGSKHLTIYYLSIQDMYQSTCTMYLSSCKVHENYTRLHVLEHQYSSTCNLILVFKYMYLKKC